MSDKTKYRKEKIALTKKQISDFLNTIKEENKKHSERNHIIAKTWFLSGMRVSEISNFKIEWLIKADQHYIFVQKNDSPYAFKPKYGSSRKIPIPKELYKELIKHLKGRKTGYVFMPQTNRQYARFHTKSLINLFNKYFIKTKSISRNLGSHTFRRTFATQLEINEPPVPITRISEYLGHRNIATTIGYLKKIKIDDHEQIMKSKFLDDMIKL